MKTLPVFRIIFFTALIFSVQFTESAESYIPLTLSGFNADVVCNAAGCTGTNTLDNEWYFYSAEKKQAGSLPQVITSKMGVKYKLASFDGKNALTIGNNGIHTATLTPENPVQTSELWILGLSANGVKNVTVTVNYTDNSTSGTIEISFPDWYQSTGGIAAYYGLDRVKSSSTYDGRSQFGLFEQLIPVDAKKTVKSVDLSLNENSYTTIFAMSAFIPGSERAKDKELYFVSNAHFDTQWDWDVQTSIDQYLKNTLEGNFNLFEKYPNYTFNFEGAVKYMFAKEYYPDLYTRLKQYVASGRWHISGGSIDANDVMVPSAESVIRNFLLGQEFYKKEFGIKGGNDIMLPDCFGFPYSLPTLGKHCGIIGFHSQKLSWGSAYNYDDLPLYNVWRGVDGSEILAVHKPGAYVNQYKKNMSYDGDVLNEIVSNKEELGAYKTMRYFGTGDRGGSIDPETADWLEKSIGSDGPVTVKIATPDQFFESITPEERAKLPIWDNELPMKTHGVGCYTSQTILKYWNRKNELLADATEKSSVLADWLGHLPYQSDKINENWIRVLWHQFHDDLTGTAIPKAYSFTFNDHILAQLNFSKTLTDAVGAVVREMDTQVNGIPVVVYNPLSVERDDVVEGTIEVFSNPENISVYDKFGNPVATQKLSCENGILKFLFAAKAPSLGYAVYDLRLNDNASAAIQSALIVTENTLENEEYKITINNNGDISSVKDKKQGDKELLRSPIRMSLQSDQPGYWGSWEISREDVYRAPTGYVDENVSVSIAENGALRAALKITRSKKGSDYVQYIRLTSGVNADRIDFINEVNWQSKETLLKAVFPLTAVNPNAKFDLSIGAVDRGNRKENLYEVSGHQWADLTHSDDSYGISILNDCKYGWDKPENNTLRLTLIHTPKTENDRSFQKYQDLGLNKFTYSFYRHIGVWNEETQWEAAKLNQPLVAVQTPKHGGSLGKSVEFVNLNTEKVAVKALKKAEASDDMIIRVYELTGDQQDNVEIAFPVAIVSAKEVNGLEEEIGDVSFSENKLTFNIGKFQPKTFAVKLAAYTGTTKEPSSEKIALPYNIDVMSSDTKMNNGKFGSSIYAYPTELISDEIISEGIKFSMGPRTDDKNNAVQCLGQEIDLPRSTTGKKLYLLAASVNKDGSKASFMVDGISSSVEVECFADYVGQWETVYASRFYKKENVAFTATHRHNTSIGKNESYNFLYMFKYMIPVNTGAAKLTLPNDPEIIVFAVSLSDNENDDVKSITENYSLPEFNDIDVNETSPCAPRIIPPEITASGFVSDNEDPGMAADNNSFTKWCHSAYARNKYLQYDFGRQVTICQWNVLHAGIENENNITSDFVLQRYDNGSWIDVDVVTGNKENKTVRVVEPFTSDKVRLKIVKGEQNAGLPGIARIYEFNVFGTGQISGIDEAKRNNINMVMNYPNPFSGSTTIRCNVPVETTDLHLSVFDITGKLVSTTTYPVSAPETQEIVWNQGACPESIYFYTVSVNSFGQTIQTGTGKMVIVK